MAAFSTTIPLLASQSFDSPSVAITNGGTRLTGTVFTDQDGTLLVEQSPDGFNWDASTSIAVTGGVGLGWSVDIIAPWVQLVYNNGDTAQTIFRLYGDVRDDDGNFVSQEAPSPGGEYAVLQGTPNGGYTYVGRFNGNTAWDAASFAAVALNASGKYAAFDVATATVASETVSKTTSAIPASF
jgi:hypothetical protein